MIPGPPPEEIELVRVRLDLRRPLRSAHGTEVVRDVVLVRLTASDGTVGWGECSALARPTYTGEHTDGAWAVLRDHLVPAALRGEEAGVVDHPMAVTALGTARLDASLRRRDRSLAADLGSRHGRPAEAVAVATVLGRGDGADDLIADVAVAVAAGAVLVKIKVTPRPADLEAVAAVRATWPDLVLAADGNGSLDARSVSVLDALDLAYLEQPLPADALVASAALAERCATPIALDESITSPGMLDVALALGAGQVLNLKPARVGGLEVAAELAARAADAGWPVFVGGMLETGVGRAAAVAVAALPACTLPTDLGPSSRYVVDDVTAPLELDGAGRLPVPVGPGIGVVPLDARLADVATDRLVLRR